MSLKHAGKRRRVKRAGATEPKVEHAEEPDAIPVIDLDVGDVATEAKTEIATEPPAVARSVMPTCHVYNAYHIRRPVKRQKVNTVAAVAETIVTETVPVKYASFMLIGLLF